MGSISQRSLRILCRKNRDEADLVKFFRDKVSFVSSLSCDFVEFGPLFNVCSKGVLFPRIELVQFSGTFEV